jgi:ABC-type branched-subunit amino acid transport system ATPase component
MDATRLWNVTKRFDGATAVNDLSLSIPAGSIYDFIGPNGSGKIFGTGLVMQGKADTFAEILRWVRA